MVARIACLHPVGWDGLHQLAQELTDYHVLPTEQPERLAAWLDDEQVAAVLLVCTPAGEMPEFPELAARHSRVPVIALVRLAHLADQAVRRLIVDCCHDYHTLPLDGHRLRVTLGHAVGLHHLWSEWRPVPVREPFHGMVGESERMQALFRDLQKVASAHAPVHIGGESGTGKELAARAVHLGSTMHEGPFVVVNCGALPASLIAAELFGHERGAFTGADARRQGRLEQADGGTVFLDEIGDLPLDLQSHLLRFLQEGTVDRLGSRESLTVRARVIAASHVDLAEAVEAGRFREDLYYRLNVLHLRMPALRERGEDVPLLARHFLEAYRRERGGRCHGFTPQALELMQHHDWPGNVRELSNRVRRAVIMTEGARINAANLGLERRQSSRMKGLQTVDEARREAERGAVIAALNEAGHNISAAARQIGVSRVTLYRLMQRHRIDGREGLRASRARGLA